MSQAEIVGIDSRTRQPVRVKVEIDSMTSVPIELFHLYLDKHNLEVIQTLHLPGARVIFVVQPKATPAAV